MANLVRRLVFLLAAAVLLTIAVVWGIQHEHTVLEAATQRANAEARVALTRAQQEVAGLSQAAVERARGFANYDTVTKTAAQTSADDVGQLVKMLRDGELNETWLRPWTELGTVGLAFDLKFIFVSGGGELAPDINGLLSFAASAEVGRVMVIDGAPMLVGLAPSKVHGPQQQSVVAAMVMPLDEARLLTASTNVGSPLMLAVGERVLTAGASANVLSELKSALSSTELLACCATGPLEGSTARLAVYVDPSAPLAEARAVASRDRIASGLVGGLLAVILLVFGLRRPASSGAEHTALLRETAAELQRSREEMQRLSQRISSGGITLQSTPEEVLGQTAASIQISRYEVVAPLGEGGMAKVSVAQTRGAEGFRRVFVVKRLRPELTTNQELVNQFIDEARMGASLVHSNIVPVFDFGRDAEGYFIAQEYILGRDVDAVIQASKQRRGSALESSVVLYIAQEALKALSYAHSRTDDQGRPLSLVHRDVSPNNLMVSARGELKLLDFGIVKSDQRLTRTQTGVVKGNLYFMSPEQARAEEVDARSDLFSLGLVLFTASTGETLYTGASSYELLTRSGNAPTPEDFRRIDASVPSPLAGLIRRALQPRPSDRFADADEFARAVAAVGGVASSAEVQSLMEWLFKDDFAVESSRFSKTT